MKLTTADVEHVALLSRLDLGEEEKTQYAGELSRILDYVEALAELDTTNVEPTAHPLPIGDVFRADARRLGLSNEEAIANAPQKEDGCFVVPQIV
jgi:aspartyl-tRNA(Asn)/glutamyl-tRNA(Gln) amidotransferase subunit C